MLTIEDAIAMANPARPRVSDRAELGWGLHLGEGCVIHAFAVVGHKPSTSAALARQPTLLCPETRIGARTIISPHAVIYAGVIIGDDCLIGDGASIREGTVIGDRCTIGRHATIMHDAAIADDVHIHDGAHITGYCVIGAGCFFGPGALTSNDRRLDPTNYRHIGADPPRFGRHVLVGTGANVLAGVTVGDRARIGAGAVVVDHVPAGALVLGHKATARVDVLPQPIMGEFAPGTTPEQQAALSQYWNANTPEKERDALLEMFRVGLEPNERTEIAAGSALRRSEKIQT